jgi:hypothetical protein
LSPATLSCLLKADVCCVIISGGVQRKQSRRVVDEFSWEKEHNMPQTKIKVFAYLRYSGAQECFLNGLFESKRLLGGSQDLSCFVLRTKEAEWSARLSFLSLWNTCDTRGCLFLQANNNLRRFYSLISVQYKRDMIYQFYTPLL